MGDRGERGSGRVGRELSIRAFLITSPCPWPRVSVCLSVCVWGGMKREGEETKANGAGART